jgi:hypothetical protein
MERASQQRFFLASALAVYRSMYQLNENQLAMFLECLPKDIPRLSLCRRPDPMVATFQKEVERIGTHMAVNVESLVRLLREVDAVDTLRQSWPSTDHGMLLAARDHDQAEPLPKGPEGERPIEEDVPQGKK